jgi:hypothetical protein
MAATSLLFKHQIGSSESGAVAKRRNTLLNSVADIEKAYTKAAADPKLSLPGVSRRNRLDALKFYNAVVTDGRYIDLLATAPQTAADKLGLKISKKTIDLVEQIFRGVHGPGTVQGPVEAVIAVAVVVAVAISGRDRIDERIVIDSSANVALKL